MVSRNAVSRILLCLWEFISEAEIRLSENKRVKGSNDPLVALFHLEQVESYSLEGSSFLNEISIAAG